MTATAEVSDRLGSAVWKAAGTVVIGSFMAILDSTVVNVALPKLTVEFQTSFATIQWVATAYMLALAMAIPVTGWAADRFGTKRLYLVAIVVFLAGSVLAGMAWSVESLIVFRVLQGIGGGVLGPAGTIVLVKAAGPQRVGRVMAVLGLPMLLGPVTGPVLGGWLVDVAGWRWLFFVNVPIGLVAFVLAWKVLPRDEAQPSDRFDFVGMLLLSPGLASLIFSAFMLAGGAEPAVAVLPGALGVLCIGGFLLRARRISNPLIDIRLFRDRTFSTSVITLSLFFVGFLGSGVLFPAYFLLARGESALRTGLLLVPASIGAMITIPLAGKLADQIGAGRIVLPGLAMAIPGMAVFTQVDATTPYWLLVVAQFVMGLGMGATMIPLMSAAMRNLAESKVARASTALSIMQQAFGAIGAATMSIILAGRLAGQFNVPTAEGQLAATEAMDNPGTRHAAAELIADAYAYTFSWALVLLALCLVPAVLLSRQRVLPGDV